MFQNFAEAKKERKKKKESQKEKKNRQMTFSAEKSCQGVDAIN